MGDETPTPRISGYLEKKGKMRMMSTWKRYWFVLECRLLLYYRSKDEYDAISPCKGSINLGPPCSVKSCPSVSCVFQIQTRNNTITLRAENGDEQKLWMQSIMTALNQNQSVKVDSKKQLNYFRYSLSYLVPQTEPNKEFLERQSSVPPDYTKLSSSSTGDRQEIIDRLRRIGAQTYGGSLNSITKCGKSPTSCPIKINDQKRSNSSNNVIKRDQHIYERISNSSTCLDNLIIDNDNYSVPIKQRFSLHDNPNSDIIIDNTQYCGVIDDTAEKNEYVYEEVPVDCNENNVIIDNLYYKNSTENEYEDLDKYRNNSGNNNEKKQNSKKLCHKINLFNTNNNNKNNKSKEKSLKKSESFLQKVWKKRNRKATNSAPESDEYIYEEVNSTVIEKTELSDSSTVQILSELQQILEIKKPILKQSLAVEPTKSQPTPETLPTLPPKENKIKNIAETVRSIDEILKCLNDERKESKTKVKRLIDKFNSDRIDNNEDVADIDGDLVELRHSTNSMKTPRYSNDLNQLLDELAKVTVAPIMTPGVTISLINPNITDDELLKLLPVRKRRLSEPDYDVPRSHRSIQALTKPDDDTLQATRFFGPILDHGNKDECVYASMTPDSLEIDESADKTEASYTSHCYQQLDDEVFSDNNNNNNGNIYSAPKRLLPLHKCKKVEGDNEVFNDSLEDCNECYTKF